MASGGRLMHAAASANANGFSRGMLPPSSCRAQGAAMLMCSHPTSAIASVRFTTYPSLRALYAAYERQFRALGAGRFRQNFGNCTTDRTYGEVAWNHASQHPRTYTVAQMMAGQVNLNEAFGRVFCTFAPSGAFYIAWTNDPDRLLGIVTGNPHDTTWGWWHRIHHTFSLSSTGMAMGG
jgi:hypothetical protein